MKKIKLLALLFVLPLTLSLTACNGRIDENTTTPEPISDKYRNYYEIFPYSFADSNNDGIGDLQGIIDKFDYIKDLGYTGIWLTPIHPSETYHKYDVDDYYNIDPAFGTIEDYDKLVELCHQNNMAIILDLVLNHSSDSNEWFTKSLYDHARNLTNDKYYNYYNIETYTGTLKSGWATASLLGYPNLAYECQFWTGMPDLNLQYVLDENDGYLAKEIEDIMKFWLIDRDIDGFRLDAVTSYFTANSTKNQQFLTWLNAKAKAIKPSAYIVGEGAWGNVGENEIYYTSGIDSFFNFEDSQSSGYIAQAIARYDATLLEYAINKNLSIVSNGGIPAPFIANHDTGRLIGAVAGNGYPEKIKIANGFLQMMNGATFSYYGDEAGMTVQFASGATKYNDEDKRQPMPWADEYRCKPVIGSVNATDEAKYPYGTIESQLANSNSIINYVKKANLVRNQNIEIARGIPSLVYSNERDYFAVTKKTYNDSSVYIAMNLSSNKSFAYDYSEIGTQVVGQLVVDNNNYIKKVNDTEIEIPPYGIAIIR
jgi:alpha-amylase